MTTNPSWPSISSIIHHTRYRGAYLSVAEAAERCCITPSQLCAWAKAHAIPLYVSPSGFCIAEAALMSALTRRSRASQVDTRPY
jgi:hypothetical protein